MEDAKTAVARAIVRDLINAVSEGMDIAGTVEQVPHKMAAVGGAVDRVIDKYGLDSGMVAALAVMAEDIELKELVDIDYAAIEQRIALELHRFAADRSMALGDGLTLMVTGGLPAWQQANAIYSMVSDQAREGLAAYFLAHGIKPLWESEKPWSSAMMLGAIMARAEEMDDAVIRAAHIGLLAFMTLVRHSEELVAQDNGSGHVDHANLNGNLNRVDTGRKPTEVPMQTIPTTQPFVSNPKFRMEEAASVAKPTPHSDQIAESDSLPAFTSNPAFRTEGTETGRFDASKPNQSNVPKEAMTCYCMKCKTQVIPEDAETVEGNGSPVYQGKCPECGSKVRRQLPKPAKES